ncbi:MAG: SBBP repeat-containing protein [Candidatus Aminicenantes bacterium]|nr:SBBP repeat-containing protein [Candidatus Aminicenantes bacterium]
MAIDGSGSVYVCGSTNGSDFPVKNAFQNKSRGRGETFISKLAPSGKALVYSSYLGGPAYDMASSLSVDGTGAVDITGRTDGAFPLKNAFQPKRKGGGEGFVSKVAPDGQGLVYSTYLGGSGTDYPFGIAVDGSGAAHIVGCTYSYDWPLKDPSQSKLNGSVNAFLSILSPNGLSLVYSTYLGGLYKDSARSLLVDLKGTIYVAGGTNSPDFPLLKPFQKTFAGKLDIFILKFNR